jgi:hypothetical protein
MRRAVLPVLLVTGAILMASCSSSDPDAQAPAADTDVVTGEEADEADGGEAEEVEGEERGGANEAAEKEEDTEKRLEALEAAEAAGTFGQAPTSAARVAAGWYPEYLLNRKTDDWETAVAADPRKPLVYVLTTRYDIEPGCTSHCRLPYIPVTISRDGGQTWEKSEPICSCRKSHGQYDPTIEVVPSNGDVYSAYLTADRNGAFSTVFQKSTNHGRSWSEPVRVYGRVGWTDKPEITMSANGKHVYVAWNGPQGGDPWVGVSHDYGQTWSQTKVNTSKRYFFAYDGTVLPDGTVVFSQSSLIYGGQGASFDRTVRHYAIISRDKGKTWESVLVDDVQRGPDCVADGCSGDYYLGQASVANDPQGNLVFAYEGAPSDGEPQRIYTRTSTDEGRTWGRRVVLSVPTENATGPRIDSAGNGDARVWYFQTANGGDPDAWNVWYRRSSDGGATWSNAVKLNSATSGPGYLTPDGFLEPYGDYGEIAVTNQGAAVAVWGAGFSYTGPGGTWIAVQQ